jgi:cytochrome c6
MTRLKLRLAAAVALAAGFAVVPAHADDAKLALGKKVFLEISEPQCALCHTLADAGSKGEVGPILDELKPDEERVKKAVTEGIGPMPANEVLSQEQIDAVALYVSTVAGKK